MVKLCIFVGTLIGSYGGWALAAALGAGFGWAFFWSSVGSLVGVWAGWKVGRQWE